MVRAAIDRQDQALAGRREPEQAFTDGQALTGQLRARAHAAGRCPGP
ncbi:hypothetical protein [Streptomyces sp.]